MEGVPNKKEKSGQPSLEGKDVFRTRLNAIIGQSITVTNIDIFADSALNELISFIEDTVERYATEHPEDTSTGKDLEDHAFSAYGLDDLNDYLVRIQEKSDQIHRLDDVLQSMNHVQEVITPTDENGSFINGDGNPLKERMLIPRVKLLLYILDNDFDLRSDDIRLTRGVTDKTMVRRESYITAEIDALHRVVQICDEEGNASYVFDSEILAQKNISIDDLNRTGKEEKNELINKFEGIGARLIQKTHWRDAMSELLSSPIEKKEKQLADENLPAVITSEFDPWRGFFEDEGTHWGSVHGISQRIGSSEETVARYIKKHPELSVKKGKDLMKRESDLYPLERIESDLKGFLSLPQVETSGEWYGFLEKDGVHWGTAGILSKHFKVSHKAIMDFIKRHPEIPPEKARDVLGKKVSVFPLEKLESADSHLKDLVSLPSVTMNGRWRGFLESENMHWGALGTLVGHLKIKQQELIVTFLKKHSEIQSKKARDLTGKEVDVFPLEKIESYIKDHVSLPDVATEGEWRGFFESEGMHWGAISTIAHHLDLDTRHNTFRRIVKNHPELPYKDVLDLMRKKISAYPLEQVEKLYNEETRE